MEFFRSWMLSIVSAALAGMLVYILAPKGGTKKAVRMVAAVFFLTAFFLPFGSVSVNDFFLPDIAYNQPLQTIPPAIEQTLEEQILRAHKDVIVQQINLELQRLNISPPRDISFDEDMPPDGRIAITRVRIKLTSGDGTSSLSRPLEAKIKEATGLEVKVILEL